MPFRLKFWFNQHKRDVFLGILIFLIATTAFGLGYLYAENTSTRTPIVIEKNDDK